MDNISKAHEEAAYNSTRQLQLWLCTIAPVNMPELLDQLELLCKEMKWETVYDVVLGRDILG